MERGYWIIGRFQGAPIRMHWSAPLGALLFGGLSLRPAFLIGFFSLIFIHELGHALVVKACRRTVVSIDIMAFGGLCRWSGSVTALENAMIAWGGVWAQAGLFVLSWLVLRFATLHDAFWYELLRTFIDTNLHMALLNLLPIAPLDGASAWPLFAILWRRLKWRMAARRPPPPSPPNDPPPRPWPVDQGPKPDPKRAAEVEATFNKVLQGVLDVSIDPDEAEGEQRPKVSPGERDE